MATLDYERKVRRDPPSLWWWVRRLGLLSFHVGVTIIFVAVAVRIFAIGSIAGGIAFLFFAAFTGTFVADGVKRIRKRLQ